MRVECVDLVKRYPGGAQALRGLSLRAARGSALAVLGPSGCGKSTLLRVIAGLEEPSSGAVRLDNADASGLAPAQRGVGLIAQDAGLYPHLTIGESIAMAAGRATRTEAQQRVHESAAALGIAHVLARAPGEISGGERRRAALARELVRGAKVMLLDEPTASLDASAAAIARAEIAEIRARLNATVILVTHDQDEAFALGERLAVMREGRIDQEGSPEEIYQKPANRFIAAFVGRPPMSFIPGRVVQDAGAWFAPAGDLPRVALAGFRGREASRAAEGEVLLGVRPSRVRLGAGEWRLPVARVERLVERSDVFLRLPGGALLAASPAEAKAGETVRVEVQTVHASFFEPDAVGRRLDVEVLG
ncbi:sulfate transport system ATP-binding protein [Phycisphaerales bacterium]|nr:sulfate transport system ATP-binding protein [Phycisphaerales bacterium]